MRGRHTKLSRMTVASGATALPCAVKGLLPSVAAFAVVLTATAALATPITTATARLIRVTSPVNPRARAILVARVVPARRCTITVTYKSGPSHAKGLHPKRSAHGRVSWTWTVEARAPSGTWPIQVRCGSAGSFRTHFTVASFLS